LQSYHLKSKSCPFLTRQRNRSQVNFIWLR
jgi:hypothetical protein